VTGLFVFGGGSGKKPHSGMHALIKVLLFQGVSDLV
jgi:hypothetical protein